LSTKFNAVYSKYVLTRIDNIPGVAPSFVSPYDLFDVIFHNTKQRSIVESAVGYPAWKLLVPDKSMAAEILVILNSVVDDLIGIVPAELTAVWLRGNPFLRVFGCNRSEFVIIVDDIHLLAIVSPSQGGPDIRSPFCTDGSIKACRLARGSITQHKWSGFSKIDGYTYKASDA
jgi:hypothetical protein